MTPVSFPEQNAVLAENQKEYVPLPVHRTREGLVVSCWRPTFWQRIKLLVTGRLWVLTLTFGDPLQPLMVQTEKPFAPTEQSRKQVEA
jgi:hypothetical protein